MGIVGELAPRRCLTPIIFSSRFHVQVTMVVSVAAAQIRFVIPNV